MAVVFLSSMVMFCMGLRGRKLSGEGSQCVLEALHGLVPATNLYCRSAPRASQCTYPCLSMRLQKIMVNIPFRPNCCVIVGAWARAGFTEASSDDLRKCNNNTCIPSSTVIIAENPEASSTVCPSLGHTKGQLEP